MILHMLECLRCVRIQDCARYSNAASDSGLLSTIVSVARFPSIWASLPLMPPFFSATLVSCVFVWPCVDDSVELSVEIFSIDCRQLFRMVWPCDAHVPSALAVRGEQSTAIWRLSCNLQLPLMLQIPSLFCALRRPIMTVSDLQIVSSSSSAAVDALGAFRSDECSVAS